MKKLNEISNKLISIKKVAENIYEIYKDYLTKIAKNYDVIKNDIVKRIYIKSSEEIIVPRIKYYLGVENNFLNIYDTIKPLINFFNN